MVIRTVDGWVLTRYTADKAEIYLEGPNRQTASLEPDGALILDVLDDERGRGWNGDCAMQRSIPINIVFAAYDLWKNWPGDDDA